MNSDELLRNPHMVEFARELGLIVLVWGTASNDSKNMKRLKELGVHGLIYDRLEHCHPIVYCNFIDNFSFFLYVLSRIQEHKQAGTISMLKLNKSAKKSISEDDQQLQTSDEIHESGRSTPSLPPPPYEGSEQESGTSTPSHHPPTNNNGDLSLNAQSLADALQEKLGLDTTSSRSENGRRLTVPSN